MPDSQTGRDTGKNMPATRISIDDARRNPGGQPGRGHGVLRRILGARETWRGNSLTSTTLNWVNMRLPDGPNHVEFML